MKRAPVTAMLVGAVLASACGGDDGAGAGADAGEACLQAGYTMTGCRCDGDRVGARSCSEDLVWTPCSCPPPRPEPSLCQREGQPVRCDPCPGESKGHDTACTADLTFDCTCAGPGDDAGGGDDAG